jgi:hypothetical protein
VSLKFVEQSAKCGGPPEPRADAPAGLLFVNRSQSRTGGSGADEGVRPTPSYVADFRDTALAALVVSLPAGRGSATPSKDQHSPQSRLSM